MILIMHCLTCRTPLLAGSRGGDDVLVLERHFLAEGGQALAGAGVIAEQARVGVIGCGDHLHPQGFGYAAAGWVGHEHELREPSGQRRGLPWPVSEGCVYVVKGVTGQRVHSLGAAGRASAATTAAYVAGG